MNSAGARIKQRREELGLSMQDVGDRCGVAKSTVMRWENGTPVKQDKLLSLSTALQVTADYPLGLSDTPTREGTALTATEVKLFEETLKAKLFDLFVSMLPLRVVTTDNGDSYLIGEGVDVKLTPEIAGELVDESLDYFLYRLARLTKANR